ncbi:MAG: methyltransferase [Longimicrobiales bacterium]|nr:methyltransferase [Longimicrobiales bacterium]
MLDSARYVFALLWLISFPILLFWIALHPFVAFWRRMGLAATYTMLLTGCAAVSAILFGLRGPLLAVEFGTGPVFWGLAAVTFAASLAVEIPARKHLRPPILVGVPELRGEGSREALLTTGIYAKIRHPRYVGATLGYVASAFLANYLFLYAALPVLLLLLHTIVLLEERELLGRFGDPYRAYMERVPRYVPRLRE